MGSCHRGAVAVHGEILVEFDPPGPQGAPAMTTTSVPILAPTLAELVERLDDAVRAPERGLDVPHAVGEALRPFLGLPGLLTQEQEAGDADRYRTHLLHVPDNGAYSLVAAVWRPGQRTAVHDHIAWCVVGVHRGQEHEVRYRLLDGHLVEDGHTVGPCGEVTVLTPPGDIHAVVNDGTSVAASLHVYGADLRRRGTSVRRCYSLPVRSRSPRRPAWRPGESA
jgi:predicted metal-dependent enzyme (double-stranded beta helix superfamily)